MEDELLKRKKNNKKKIILGSIIGVLIGTLISVSYAAYTYNRTGLNNKLITGDIYMRYKEGSALNLQGAMPSNSYPAKATNNYYEFQIIGKNTSSGDISYTLKLAHGDIPTGKNSSNRIADKWLYFKLVEVSNLGANNESETVLVANGNYTTIPNSTIYTETIPKNTTNETTRTFRLYARISENVGIGTNATFTMDEWNDLYASIKINVDGGFVTPSILGTTQIISNYEQDNNPSTNGGIVGINANGETYNQNANQSSTTNNNALTNNLVNKTNETKASKTDNTTTIREYRYSGNSGPSPEEASPETPQESDSTMKN